MNRKLQCNYQHGGKLLILGGIVFLCLILFFQVIFQKQMRAKVEEQMQVHLKEVSEQISDTIKIQMEECLKEVQLLTAFMTHLPGPIDETVIPILKDAAYNSNVSRFAVVTKDQAVYNSSHTIQANASNYRYGDEVFEGKSGFSEIFVSSATGETVISIYQPVYRNGVVDAGVFGTIVVEELEDMVQFSGFNHEGYSYLMQDNGDIIMWTKHPNRVQGYTNYFDFIATGSKDCTISLEHLQENIKEKKSGVFSYTAGTEKRKAYYQSVGFKDWYLISVVPHNVFDAYKMDLSSLAFNLTVKTLLLCLGLVGIVIFWMKGSQHRLKSAYYETLNSNKKYEMAMVHTNFNVFEYNIHHACFIDASNSIISMFCGDYKNAHGVSTIDYHLFQAEAQHELSALISKPIPQNSLVIKELQKQDGTWIQLTITAVEQLDGIHLIGVAEDITHVKELESQYLQEEQYCHAMLGEAILGFSMDLETKRLLSSFQKGEEKSLLSADAYFDDFIINQICKDVHPDYRKNIEKIYNLRELKRVHALGVKEISDYFMVKLPKSEEYIWASTVIHFLKSSVDGHPLVFAYMKNVNDKKKRELELEYQSERDGLTGLYNRIAFVRNVEMALATSTSGHAALFMTDLDGFKSINDTFGHQAGDALLCEIGEVLRSSVDETQYVGRLGGDEFILFLHGFDTKEDILHVANQICNKIEALSMKNYEDAIFTISIGVVFCNNDSTFETIYKKADLSLYEAKHAGKNRVCVFSEEKH